MSISNIKNLNISKNILSKGFTKLIDIQNRMLGISKYKKDLFVTIQTGSGKTIAYFLSIQNEISLKKIRILLSLQKWSASSSADARKKTKAMSKRNKAKKA